MAVQINVAANQAALTASIQAGVQAYNQRFAQNNPINLSINQRAFSQPLGRMTGDVKDFEAALAASNARVIAFGASTAVLGGVIRSFKELANVTIDVEKNLADINRVFGLTTSQLQKFSTDLFSVGKQTASSFDDASKAALEFSRQGLKAEEVLIRTKDALTLARVAGISTANSVDALTSTINGFSATGITTTQILNKLVAVEQDFAVGAGDLAEALSRTGQAAQEAGVSLDQLNALVTAAQQSTARGGAVIGNALKTIFTRLQRTDTLDQLEAFNIAVRDVQGNTLPAVTILQNFAGAYKGLADAQRAQLSEQVAGVYQVNILKAIVGDLNKSQGVYAGALQRGASATNEAEVATAKLNQTLDALLKQTATSTQQLANNIGKVTFEPLARYGTEQLKSLVESMNEILEGEGVGSTFANGLLKGIRNVIAGPGAIAAFFTLFKLIQNSFTYLAQALPQIAGITTETQNRKNIEQSILQIMQQQGPVSQALAGTMGNQAAQAQLLLQIARQQTAEYQMQSTLAKQLAAQLATQGVRVKGSGGLQVTRAGGYIPAATRMAEVVGAQAGGYAPGRVVSSPVGGVMNTAEDVKYVPGFAQPFINPPAGSKAGRAHRQNAISRTGVDPYMAGGFIPNFALTTLGTVKERKYASKTKQNSLVTSKTNTGPKYDDLFAADIVKKQFNLPYDFLKNMARTMVGEIYHDENQLKPFIDQYKNKVDPSSLTRTETALKNIKNTSGFTYALNQVQGLLGEAEAYDELKQDGYTSTKGNKFFDLSTKDGKFAEVRARKKVSINDVFQKAISQYLTTTDKSYYNTNNDFIDVGSYDVISPSGSSFFSKGFIPNFAPPTSAIRIPWFKKFGNASFDAVQPTLGISKAGDLDTFRQINFRSNAKGADKVGDSNLFAPLYEDFVFKALQLISQSKIKDQLIRGYALQPGTDQKQSAFDAFLGDVAFEKKGFPKGNLTGSISQNLNDKYERYAKANPAGAAKIKESIIVFNELGHENQITSDFGKNFTQLAGTSYSQMVKNSPDLVKGLSAETNMLLGRYVKNPAFLAMNAAKGFIPNFADFIDVDTLGKNSVHYSGDLMKLIKDIESSVGRHLTSGELRLLTNPKTNLSKLNDPKILNRFINSERKGGFAGFAKGFTPNFANQDFEILREIIRLNKLGAISNNRYTSSEEDDKNNVTRLYRGVKGISERWNSIDKNNPQAINKAIFEKQSGNKTMNEKEFVNKSFSNLAFSHRLNWPDETENPIPFLSTSKKEDVADMFATSSGLKGSITIKNSRLLGNERRYENLYKKYGKEKVKGILYKLSKTGGGKGLGLDFVDAYNSGNAYKGYGNEGEIGLFSRGFIPNFAKELEATAGYGSSIYGELNRNKLSIESMDRGNYPIKDPASKKRSVSNILYSGIIEKAKKIIGKDKDLFITGELLPQDKGLAFPQGLSRVKLAKTAIGNLVDPKGASKKLNKEQLLNLLIDPKQQQYLRDSLLELTTTHSKGFIPNFAYKQAVMGLEESMSGNKAVFDTKPFPHIRNKSQPTFSSAVADHGGLSNALSDSMRGQKDAGLMNRGFVPNFAAPQNNKDFDVVRFSSLISKSVDDFGKKLSNKIIMVRESILLGLDLMNTSFDPRKIERTAESTAKKIISSISNAGNVFNNSTKASPVASPVASQRLTAAQMASSFGNLPTKNPGLEKFSEGLSKASTAIAIAGPMLAGFAEQAMYGNKKRTDMTSGERMGQSALSTGLTSFSTGAGIGASFGLPGAIIGGAIGGLVGLTSALSAATLSAEELGQLNQEQTQKSQASISAASSYIEAQKSLSEMIMSGASSSDIENATKKLSSGFNDIADVKLQEIFNQTGGDVKQMAKQLQDYTNQVSKKTAFETALVSKGKEKEKEVAKGLSFSLSKEQKNELISGLLGIKAAKESSDLKAQQIATSAARAGGTAVVSRGDEGASYVKEVVTKLLKSQGYDEQNTKEYASLLSNAVDTFMSLKADKFIEELNKLTTDTETQKAVVNFNEIATKSFTQIFIDIQQAIKKSTYDIALSFEKDSGARKIQSAVLDFSMNFQDSINSFISSNLPDARKFDFTAATASQKAQMLLQKSQQDYDKALAEQTNERSNFLIKNSENLVASFNEAMKGLPSQISAQFFQKEILPEIQKGTFKGDARSVIERSQQIAAQKVDEASIRYNDKSMNLKNSKDVDAAYTNALNSREEAVKAKGQPELLDPLIKSLLELKKANTLYANEEEKKKLDNALANYAKEQEIFELKQANAKKEAEINKQLTDVKIQADKLLATEKAKVDKENLMRLESVKNISAAISNNLEISKARSNAKVNTLQGDLADPRLDYGSSAKEVTGRKIAIESQILKTQRAEEDAAISAEIQQRVLQMAAEQDNTNALYELNKTIIDYMGNLLQKDLGGASAIAEMQNNPYMGKNIAFERASIGTDATPEQTKMLDQAESYSAQFQAYQRTQQSKTSANVIGKLDAAGFNATGADGKLLMSQKDQLDTLTKMSEDYEKSGDVVAKGIVDRYKAEIINKKTSLAITRENIDEEVRRKAILEQQSHILTERFKKGYSGMSAASDRMIEDLVERTPERFADGMTNALMEVAKGTKSIGDAFKDMAINFGQEIMQAVMRAAIGKMVGSSLTSLFGQAGGSVTSSKIGRQTGGVIHAQNGMYISGGRTGDKNPAMLEDGEYVLNREAVKAFGGVNNLDKMNYDMAPRFGKKMQGGGSVDLFAEMGNNKKGEYDYTGNLMSGSTNIGKINESDYTAYAYAESDYFKKMREKSIADEQERVQKKFEKDQKNAQLISSIVGAVGSLALAGGMAISASQAAASAASKAAESATTVSGTATDTVKKGFETAKATGGKAFTDFMKANPESVLVNGKSLSYLQSVNQVAQGLPSQAVTGQFSKFGGNAQLTGILNQQGFSAAQKTAGSGLFGSIFTTGISTTGANVKKGRQTGGLIGFNSGGFVPYGSRLSDTIPALLTGGEYVMNNTAVKKYGLGTMSSMNAGAYQQGGSTATSSNNTNNNATNIAINIDKSGKSVYGADSSSYEKQDIILTKQMAKQINGIVLRSMSNEKRYGGELYKNSSRT